MIRGRSLLALATSLCALEACGGHTTPAQPPAARAVAPASLPPEAPPLSIEYVVIHRRWVEKVVPTAAADVKAWSEAPANADVRSGPFRQILVLVPGGENDPGLAAKKKAQSIIARLQKGEDFAKLAKQLSDDPGSKDASGEYPADAVKTFVAPVRAAFAALAPGETTAAPVRSVYGFHVIRKERATDDEIERAYRKAKAPELAKMLGDDLLARFKTSTPARASIAEAVEAVLGERATNDADRPKASIVDRERVERVHLTAAAKAALETFAHGAHPGDVLPSPAVDADVIVVARASAASP